MLAERAVPPREGNGAEKLPMLASITERVTEMRHATCTIKPAARLPATPRYKNRAPRLETGSPFVLAQKTVAQNKKALAKRAFLQIRSLAVSYFRTGNPHYHRR